MLELMNEPAWKKFIGDHDIDSTDKVLEYIENKIISMYRKFGFGLWMVEYSDSNVPIGICGLIKRDSLENIDLGFGFLSNYWSRGFAYEASLVCMDYAFKDHGVDKLLAITSSSNLRSIRTLEKLSFSFNSDYSHPGSKDILSLYQCEKSIWARNRSR
ncbi:GNAT family N-acetyltransferase [Aurantivibrio infirmus]